MKLPIAQLGQPILRQRTLEISQSEIQTAEFQKLVADMLETVQANAGAGLAGPQVFVSKRIFVAAVLPPLEPDGKERMGVFINPRLTPLTNQMVLAWEGCLSFPELLALVPRNKDMRIDYLNQHGEACTLELHDWPARIVQHEYDHLEGILTIDRVPSTKLIIKASEVEAASKALEELTSQNTSSE